MTIAQSNNILVTLLRQTVTWQQARLLTACLLLKSAAIAVQSAGPLVLHNTLNRASTSAYTHTLLLITVFVACLGASRFLHTVSLFNFQRYSERSKVLVSQLVYEHTLMLPHDYHAKRDIGSLMNHITEGIGGVISIQATLFFGVLPLLLNIIAVGTILLTFDQPGIIAITVMFCVAYTLVFKKGLTTQASTQSMAARSDASASSVLTDALINHETIRLFCAEAATTDRISSSLKRREQDWLSFFKIRTNYTHALSLVYVVAFLLIMLQLAHQIAIGSVTPADFIMLMLYATQLFNPLETVGATVQDAAQSLLHIGRLAPILGQKKEHRGGDRTLDRDGSFEIQLKDVSFDYHSGRSTLRNLNLCIPGGKVTAIVGASGSGKTTLSRLVFGLYDVGSGTISVNGLPVNEFDLADYRRAIAVVPQDAVLFNDTLRVNVLIARADADDEALSRAAKLAGLDPLIARLPDGWDTVVGERGTGLSGGERQRVAIARAILKQPRCFIFDEATASLDTKTERLIQSNVENISRGVTTIIIAHRLSTIVAADTIAVMDNGNIVEQGTHDQLIAQAGMYAEMWHAQSAAKRKTDGVQVTI
ncbi:ABC transporter ATP-binding protein [Xanthomonas arboricola]|uniref:ABC transporter ATP-binding protein n=1 Tax=Xanthomonas arboricola TaxID=56448 RepID=UPI000CEE0F9F|nr:ABC transporter ATP-binding protein [Xanthomonas arboricola]PPT26477.1 hypothetical protein XarbCFBP7614_15870 [Xanthomonas arboricola]